MIDFRRLLTAFGDAHAELVVIGGLALTLRGGSRATFDLDLCYARTPQNLARVVTALAPLRPRLRGADPALPFFWDVQTLHSGCNFTLVTDAGDVDLLGEVTGLGGYDAVASLASSMTLFDREVLVLDLAVSSARRPPPGAPRTSSISPRSRRCALAGAEHGPPP